MRNASTYLFFTYIIFFPAENGNFILIFPKLCVQNRYSTLQMVYSLQKYVPFAIVTLFPFLSCHGIRFRESMTLHPYI